MSAPTQTDIAQLLRRAVFGKDALVRSDNGNLLAAEILRLRRENERLREMVAKPEGRTNG